MESILIFIITIIVLAYKYLKENKGKIFAIVNKKVWLFPINSVLIFRFPFFCHNNIEDKTFYP